MAFYPSISLTLTILSRRCQVKREQGQGRRNQYISHPDCLEPALTLLQDKKKAAEKATDDIIREVYALPPPLASREDANAET